MAALCATDLARQGHYVKLFIPRLPYYYHFVMLEHNPLLWLRYYVKPYLVDYFRDSSFAFDELLKTDSASERVSVRNILKRPTRKQLASLDYLLIMGIMQLLELKRKFPQERLIYYLLHPLEIDHGHVETIRTARSNFKGKVVALSPWTARKVSDHIPEPPVVSSAIAPAIWKNRFNSDQAIRGKDILFHYSVGPNKGGDKGIEIIRELRKLRPSTQVTVWSRDTSPNLADVHVVKHFSERELCELYLSHKMFLFPSTLEGSGMPPIEGLACGCIPILYPDVGSASSYARNGLNTIFIIDNIKHLAKRIANVLDDNEKLGKMRTAGYESVTDFNPDGYGLRLLEAAEIFSRTFK